MWKWVAPRGWRETAGGGRGEGVGAGRGWAGRPARLSRRARPDHRPFLQSAGPGRARRSSLRAKRALPAPVSFVCQSTGRMRVPGRSSESARKAAPVCGSCEDSVGEVGPARGSGYRRWHAGPVMVAMFNSGRGRGIWDRPGSGGSSGRRVPFPDRARPVRAQPTEAPPPDRTRSAPTPIAAARHGRPARPDGRPYRRRPRRTRRGGRRVPRRGRARCADAVCVHRRATRSPARSARSGVRPPARPARPPRRPPVRTHPAARPPVGGCAEGTYPCSDPPAVPPSAPAPLRR